MELTRITYNGFKRLRAKHTMNVDSKLVAVVGPNDAGKTSFLRGLERLNGAGSFTADEPTRSQRDTPDTWVLARYSLDDADRAALADYGLPGSDAARELLAWKQKGDTLHLKIEPAIQRDLEPRRTSRDRLQKFNERGLAALSDEDQQVLRQLALDLDSEEETLSEEAVIRIKLAAAALQPVGGQTATRLAKRLAELHAHEDDEAASETAAEVLDGRRPRFLFFDDDARELQATYPLSGTANGALRNLLSLAGVAWQHFQDAWSKQDPGQLEGLELQANEALKKSYAAAWTQQHTPLVVRLRLDGDVLHVLTGRHSGDFIAVDRRSEGIRQFIALRAFVAAQGYEHPILLIDEAERHLHYDAQADLVQVLAEQTDVPKVIYSTHSAGCLPPDLGAGVRAVVPIEGTDDSRIENHLWQDSFGYSTLLLSMGANTLALSAARKALVSEGISDAILLPSLIREAKGSEDADYQIVPGLSHVSSATAAELDFVAARVAYLVDGDAGGRQRAKFLRSRQGVPDELIIALGGPNSGLTLEDVVDRVALAAAVNRVLGGASEKRMAATDISATGRWKSVERWLDNSKVSRDVVGKRQVAQALVDARRAQPILDRSHKKTIRAVDRALEKALNRPRHQRGRQVGN